MSAELLREAASLMRERARTAPSPWFHNESVIDPAVLNGRIFHFSRVASCNGNTAPHIASWHPAVALAVADWLENVAAWMSDGVEYIPNLDQANWTPMWCDVRMKALRVARVYLGESV